MLPPRNSLPEHPCRTEVQACLYEHMTICTLVLTVHVSFMLILNERISPGLLRPLVVDYVNLEQTDEKTLVMTKADLQNHTRLHTVSVFAHILI